MTPTRVVLPVDTRTERLNEAHERRLPANRQHTQHRQLEAIVRTTICIVQCFRRTFLRSQGPSKGDLRRNRHCATTSILRSLPRAPQPRYIEQIPTDGFECTVP